MPLADLVEFERYQEWKDSQLPTSLVQTALSASESVAELMERHCQHIVTGDEDGEL